MLCKRNAQDYSWALCLQNMNHKSCASLKQIHNRQRILVYHRLFIWVCNCEFAMRTCPLTCHWRYGIEIGKITGTASMYTDVHDEVLHVYIFAWLHQGPWSLRVNIKDLGLFNCSSSRSFPSCSISQTKISQTTEKKNNWPNPHSYKFWLISLTLRWHDRLWFLKSRAQNQRLRYEEDWVLRHRNPGTLELSAHFPNFTWL